MATDMTPLGGFFDTTGVSEADQLDIEAALESAAAASATATAAAAAAAESAAEAAASAGRSSYPGATVGSDVKFVITTNTSLVTPLPTIDGVATVSGDRVLLVGQTIPAQNGAYTVQPAKNLSRAADTIVAGMYYRVTAGTAYAGSSWLLQTSGDITVGTTSLSFVQFDASKVGNTTYTGATTAWSVGTNFSVAGTSAFTGAVSAADITSSGAIASKAYRSNGGTITMTGASGQADAFAWWTPTVAGSTNLGIATSGLYIGIKDKANMYGGTMSGLLVDTAMGGSGTAGIAGNRQAIFGRINVNGGSDPGDPSSRQYTGVHGRAFATVQNGGRDLSTNLDGTGANCGLFGGWFAADINSTAVNYRGVTGIEINVSAASGTSTKNKTGLNVVLSDDDAVQGTLGDDGVLFAVQDGVTSPGWKRVISVGRETSVAATNTASTLFTVTPKTYGGFTGVPFQWGIDFRRGTITSGGGAFASPNFGVDGTGSAYANSLTTTGTLQATSAAVSSVTVVDGGEYLLAAGTKPTFTVSAPPSAGTTATIASNLLSAVAVREFGATGSGYAVNDLMTIPTTNAVLKVATVDAHGGVTSVTVDTPGTTSAAPTNPVRVTTTTGSGTGATFFIAWAASGAYFVPSVMRPAATGSGFVVGDVLNLAEDFPAGASFSVDAVDVNGGITALSVTGLPVTSSTIGGTAGPDGFNYHAPTGGTGTGAMLGVTYGVNSITVSGGGSGYPPFPPPTATVTLQSTYRNAALHLVMTGSNATLALNPAGGTVTAGGNTVATSATTSLPSLATVGTIGAGTWHGSIISPTYGGTGVNNGTYTVTLQGNFAVIGSANPLTFTTTGSTALTLPLSGTLATTAATAFPSLTSVGTITSGTWNATPINLTSYTTGNLGTNRLNAGTNASSGTFWRGDGAWAAAPGFPKGVSFPSPAAGDKVTLFYTAAALTVSELDAVLVGSATPSATWTVRYAADRSTTGTEVVTSGTTTTTTTTAQATTSLTNPSIPAGNWVWVEITAVSGTVDELALSIKAS